jgi:hypothetical protein
VLESFASQAAELLADNPDAKEQINLVHAALVTIGQLVQMSLPINGKGPSGKNWRKKLRQSGRSSANTWMAKCC